MTKTKTKTKTATAVALVIHLTPAQVQRLRKAWDADDDDEAVGWATAVADLILDQHLDAVAEQLAHALGLSCCPVEGKP